MISNLKLMQKKEKLVTIVKTLHFLGIKNTCRYLCIIQMVNVADVIFHIKKAISPKNITS